MGWTFRSRPCSKQDYIREVLADYHPHRVVAHRLTSGLHLWSVIELTKPGIDPDNMPVGRRFICLDLLDSDRGCWGHKSISECMGPSASDCPLSFLDLAPEASGEWSAEWRERVRQWHAEAKQAPTLTPRLEFLLYGKRYRAIAKIGRSWSAELLATGQIYRVGPKHFAHIELPDATPPTQPAASTEVPASDQISPQAVALARLAAAFA